MKILLMCASPRKRSSRTFMLARKVLAGLKQEDVRIEIVHLADHRIEFCRHCEMCHKKILQCPVKDDAMALARKIIDADGIIFAAPNYINQVPGTLKALFDRHSHFIHCKRLMGKYSAAVVTSGSGYDAGVVRYLKYYSNLCGAQFSGAVTSRQDAIDRMAADAYSLGVTLAGDIRSKHRYPGQLRRIAAGRRHFARVMALHQRDWKEEYLYWQDKGWIA